MRTVNSRATPRAFSMDTSCVRSFRYPFDKGNATMPDVPEKPPAANDSSSDNAHAYWRANVRLILVLLTIWAAVSIFAGIIFVEQLNRVSIGNVPFGFWMGQQGSIVVFVLLIFAYIKGVDRIDRIYGIDEDEK